MRCGKKNEKGKLNFLFSEFSGNHPYLKGQAQVALVLSS